MEECYKEAFVQMRKRKDEIEKMLLSDVIYNCLRREHKNPVLTDEARDGFYEIYSYVKKARNNN